MNSTKEQRRRYFRKCKDRHPDLYMFHQAKVSAKKHGLEFSIQRSDIIIPATCPVFGIPLFFTHGKRTENTPSLDRVDNNKGYISGNVRVISWRANQAKRDLTREEVVALLAYMS